MLLRMTPTGPEVKMERIRSFNEAGAMLLRMTCTYANMKIS